MAYLKEMMLLKENIEKAIVGKSELIDQILVAMLCSGHVLLEDVPGLGKTVLAKSLSNSVNASFSRIQFTPDLLPSDVTGLNFFNQKKGEFEFRKGPIMNQIVLADEINRATPRTQSSLLEAMEEKQVSVDGKTYKLAEPFMVIATQNPVETSGTFELPEAQLDRFFMKLSIGYPSLEEEMEIMKRYSKKESIPTIEAVLDANILECAKKEVEEVRTDDKIIDYIGRIVCATREHPKVGLGISPRGALALLKGSKALAYLKDRDYVLPDDVKALVYPVFNHRLIAENDYEWSKEQTKNILDEILQEVSVPHKEV